MYDHACTGAECPYCSPFAAPQWERRSGKSALPRWQPQRPVPLLDSCGDPLRCPPSKVAPSTTIIIVHGAHFQEGPPWTVVMHQRRDNGRWAFPSGSMEIGESVQACAEREAYEETGLTVHLQRLTSIDSDPQHYAVCQYVDNVIQYCNITFVAQVLHGVLQQSSESLAVTWCRTDQLPPSFLPLHRWRLERAMAVLLDGEEVTVW